MNTPFLNLLPSDRRLRFEQFVLYSSIRSAVIIAGLFFLVLTAILYGSREYLNRKIESQERHTREARERVARVSGVSLEEQIRDVNTLLTRVSTLQSEFIDWTPILTELVTLTPTGITFSFLELNGVQKTVQVRGVATTRNALLAFVDALGASHHFSKPISPVSNLLQRDDISFDLSFTLTFP